MVKIKERWRAFVVGFDRRWPIPLCIGAVLAVGGFSVAGSAWSDSSVTDWIEALATGAAFLAAVVAARYAAGVFQLEEARDRRREEADNRHQAESVAAWGTTHSSIVRSGDNLVWDWMVLVRNVSSLPLYNCRLTLTTVVTYGDMAVTAVHRNLELPVIAPSNEPLQAGKVQARIDLRNIAGDEEPGDVHLRDITRRLDIAVVFRDAGNRWWCRSADGVLHGPAATSYEAGS